MQIITKIGNIINSNTNPRNEISKYPQTIRNETPPRIPDLSIIRILQARNEHRIKNPDKIQLDLSKSNQTKK
jgi:hypothetical protein